MKNLKIGWIGTGVMGLQMVKHLINHGYICYIFSRTKQKASELIDMGAKWTDTPKKLTSVSDVIFTMVGFPEDVKQVYFGKNGIYEGLKPGKILVDMTTTKPSLAIEIYKKAKEKGAYFLDAPVSGGDVGAKNATLSIMVGGDKEVHEQVKPLFKVLGENIIFQGKAGSGQHTKMCNQVVIAGTMIGVCESLLYGYKAGLDLNTMLNSITKGAAGCWTLDNLAPRIINKNFEPGFYIEHFIKDMGIAVEESKRMNLQLPGLSLVKNIYNKAIEYNLLKKGTQGLYLILENMNNADPRKTQKE